MGTVEVGSLKFAGKTMRDDERLDFALESTGSGLWGYDPALAVVRFDRHVRVLIGAQSDQLPLERFLGLFADADAEQVRAALKSLGCDEIELRIWRLDNGEEGWIALRVYRDPGTGEIIGLARDLTDSRRSDQHVHMLIREVTHRSKNLLAIIQAMARQTVKDSLTAADFEARFSARLRGLSFSHELLASQDWRGASLTELAEGHLSGLRERHGTRVQIAGPVVFVRPEAAQNIGLALNELGSNALRFGALSGEQGTVRLEWQIDADETGPKALQMQWTESGASTDLQPPSRQGFGHRVMERVVARALDGSVTMAFAPTGLRWSLRIPLVHIASDTVALAATA